MLNIIKHYKFWFTVSGILLAAGIISLAVFGLRFGIDFKGGTSTQLSFTQTPDYQKIKAVVAKDAPGGQVQQAGASDVIIKTLPLDKTAHDKLESDIKTQVGDFTEKSYTNVGPIIGQELSSRAVYQLILVALGIILYIAYAFRRVTKPVTSWKFGWAAIIALLHDLFIVVGFFSILGHFFGVEIDSLFVTAILTVLGFSVHDTIVVFDRIRENLKTHAGEPIEDIVNHSISQTVVRSLNTSLTVLFVLLALLLFGGDTIKYFVLALFVGIIAGTYSSIFIASPILVLWEKRRLRKLKRA
ncbi:protein translocase subunit SecF [Patescibacteria group bacterium]|nr:protein translocase subunit SecF [Patescibacteria group bacterium]